MNVEIFFTPSHFNRCCPLNLNTRKRPSLSAPGDHSLNCFHSSVVVVVVNVDCQRPNWSTAAPVYFTLMGDNAPPTAHT